MVFRWSWREAHGVSWEVDASAKRRARAVQCSRRLPEKRKGVEDAVKLDLGHRSGTGQCAWLAPRGWLETSLVCFRAFSALGQQSTVLCSIPNCSARWMCVLVLVHVSACVVVFRFVFVSFMGYPWQDCKYPDVKNDLKDSHLFLIPIRACLSWTGLSWKPTLVVSREALHTSPDVKVHWLE